MLNDSMTQLRIGPALHGVLPEISSCQGQVSMFAGVGKRLHSGLFVLHTEFEEPNVARCC